MSDTNLPAIVLVRPQLGENIGKAARAMLNFGLTDMRLVAPRDGWPNPKAGPAASGADLVLERARVYDTVQDAIADCAHVYATTVRKRGITKPVVTPEVAAKAIHGAGERSAILFGPERSGLETDDVALARTIITVPINPEFGSLNLAQAVILVAYEWSKGVSLAQPSLTEIDAPAPQTELDGMIAQLDDMLERANFFFPPDRVPATGGRSGRCSPSRLVVAGSAHAARRAVGAGWRQGTTQRAVGRRAYPPVRHPREGGDPDTLTSQMEPEGQPICIPANGERRPMVGRASPHSPRHPGLVPGSTLRRGGSPEARAFPSGPVDPGPSPG